jgi:hypothetical protein
MQLVLASEFVERRVRRSNPSFVVRRSSNPRFDNQIDLFQILLTPANIVAATLQNPFVKARLSFLSLFSRSDKIRDIFFATNKSHKEKRNWVYFKPINAQLNEQFTSFNSSGVLRNLAAEVSSFKLSPDLL